MEREDVAGVDLTADEEQELGELEDLGSTRTPEQSTRYRQLMEQRCPRRSPELEQAYHEKFPEIRAGFAAINRGDHDEAEKALQALAPPPRKTVAVLERRINYALRAMRSAHRVPTRAVPRARGSRPRSRRVAGRAARSRSPGRRQPDDDPELPPAAARAAA